MSTEQREFQTEVKQLLHLMIHSLYSNRDVFLRELISNASDALDRLRFAALTDSTLMPDEALRIRLRVDPEARTLSVEDNGIGMNREELVRDLGTIARSGSAEFLQALEQSQRNELTPELIGEFGVGFYSSFMVADRVEVQSRKAGEAGGSDWESSGVEGFRVEDADRATAGTTVTLHLKPAAGDGTETNYCDEWVLRAIVKKYSDFVAYPIHLTIEGQDEPEAGDTPLNSMKAIWTRPPEEVSEEEYKEFYKHISHDWNEPLLHVSTRIEGRFDARALLYLPSKAPFDLYHRETAIRGIQLYVKRVFIMDECRELLPEYLRFVKGVVDAEDLSLNVSREMLQQDRQIQSIRKHLVKKILDTLVELKQDEEKYLAFWTEFGPVLKEGLLHLDAKKERIFDLMLCATSHHPSRLTSLEDYVARMKNGQDTLYYMTGSSRGVIASSPHLEAFEEKGFEVLFFTDHVDEVWLEQHPPEFHGKKWQSVGRGEVDLGSEAEGGQGDEGREEQKAGYNDLMACLRAAIQDDVKEVRLSGRLTASPACLVLEEGDISPKIEEMLRQAGQDVPKVKRVLELNPSHPLLTRMREVFEQDGTDPRLSEYAELLYGQALLAEGGRPANPAEFSRKLTDLMVKAL